MYRKALVGIPFVESASNDVLQSYANCRTCSGPESQALAPEAAGQLHVLGPAEQNARIHFGHSSIGRWPPDSGR